MLLDYKFSIIKNNNVPTLYVNNKLLLMHFKIQKYTRFSVEVHYKNIFHFARILSNVAQYSADNFMLRYNIL